MEKDYRSLIRAYCLLSILKVKRGESSSDSRRRSLKRIVAYNFFKRGQQLLQATTDCAKKRRKRRWHVRPIFWDRKVCGAWYSLIPTMRRDDPDQFFSFMRMTPESFDWLLELVQPFILKKSQRESISPGERLAITLRYLASGDSMASLEYLFRVSDQVISNIVLETTYVIWLQLKDIVFEPLTADFWRRKAAEFETMCNFPMCIGAMDGKHCNVQKFPMRGSEHFNYKDAHSIILFAVADAKYKFIIADVGARGRESDGGVFARSDFGKLFNSHSLNLPPATYREDLKETMPYVFLGDDAFPFHPHLMKPFTGCLSGMEEQIIFNYRLCRARRVVENAFGILSARFRILRKNIIGSETLVQNIILACVALHNLHLIREDSIPPKQRVYTPKGYADMFRSNGKLKRGRWRNELKGEENNLFRKLVNQNAANVEFDKAQVVREKFVSTFISHPLPWQWDQLAHE